MKTNQTFSKKIKHNIFWIALLLLSVLLNLFSWIIPGFAENYVLYVFPLWTNLLGHFSSLFPFSIGEFMIIAGIIWLIVFVIRIKSGRFRKMTACLLDIILLIMTLNCFINYHAEPIVVSSDSKTREYTIAELTEYRNHLVETCNNLSGEVPRDTDGNIIFGDGLVDNKDAGGSYINSDVNKYISAKARESMAGLGSRFEKLSGYYVNPKPMLFSNFVSQQYMQGYYFPFSMEANYNDVMYVMNKPFTICHELAHTKGYIMEDEANFLGYLGCISSDDIAIQYSGYLGVLNYVNNAFYDNVTKDEYKRNLKILDQVKEDNVFLTDESWEKVENTAVLETETVKKAANTFVDTTLKVNGIDDGIASYDRVVKLLLDEYYK